MTSRSRVVPIVALVAPERRTEVALLMMSTTLDAAQILSMALSEGLATLMHQAAALEGLSTQEWYERRSNQLGPWHAGIDVPTTPSGAADG